MSKNYLTTNSKRVGRTECLKSPAHEKQWLMTDATLAFLLPIEHLLWPGKCFQKAKFGSKGSLPAGWEVALYLLRNSTLFPIFGNCWEYSTVSPGIFWQGFFAFVLFLFINYKRRIIFQKLTCHNMLVCYSSKYSRWN